MRDSKADSSSPLGRPARSLFSLVLMAALALGCGDGNSHLSGRVTLDGEPMAAVDSVFGTVTFDPLTPGPVATAEVDSSGYYQAYTGASPGLPPGEYGVSVRAFRSTPPANEDEMPGVEVLTPKHLATPKTSGLTVKVGPGSNTFDIAIDSKAAPPK